MIKRKFEYNKATLKNMSLTRLVVALLVGVLVIFCVYSFLNVFREVFRVLQVGFRDVNGPLLFNQAQRFNYNFLCAGVAVILGNSAIVLYVLGRPQKIFDKHSTQLKRIINDQVFLSFNFVYWLAKMLFFIGLSTAMFLDADFIQDFYYAFLVLLFVLYLESSKTIIRFLKKNKLKVWFAHFFILCGTALILANFNAIDYHKIDRLLAKVNPKINIPVSQYRSPNNDQYWGSSLFRFVSEDGRYFVLEGRGGNRIPLEDFFHYLDNTNKLNNSRAYGEVHLMAEGNTPIRFIKKLEQIFYQSKYRRIKYITRDTSKAEKKDFLTNGILMRIGIPDFVKNNLGMPEDFRSVSLLDKESYKFISVSINDSYFTVNNSCLEKKDMLNFFEKTINSNTIFQYEYSGNTTYQEYIQLISTHKQAIFNLKSAAGLYKQENACHDNYSNDEQFDFCYKEFQKENKRLRMKFPFLIKEKITD